MALQFRPKLPLAVLVAGAALAPVPAAASELTFGESVIIAPFAASAYDTRADRSQWHGWDGGWHRRGWRGRGWRGGWRRGPSAGDVLAGVVILGGIAAIASAANNNRRDREVVVIERDPPRDWERDRRDPQFRNGERRRGDAGGLNGAVDLCLDAVARDVRVDEVETVQRTAQGWRVGGTVFNGSRFDCRIGNDGRIETIDYGAGGFGTASSGQFDDSRYAAARLAAGPARPDPEGGIMMFSPSPSQAAGAAQPLVPLTPRVAPSYPGGPVDGEAPAPLVPGPGIP